MRDKVKEIMAVVFGLSVSDIPDDASSDTIEGWDSLKHINLVLALEESLGIEFKEQEIVQFKNIPSLMAIIESKLK